MANLSSCLDDGPWPPTCARPPTAARMGCTLFNDHSQASRMACYPRSERGCLKSVVRTTGCCQICDTGFREKMEKLSPRRKRLTAAVTKTAHGELGNARGGRNRVLVYPPETGAT